MKKLMSLLLAAAMILSLAACGQEPAATTPAPAVTTKAPEATTKAPEATTAAPAPPTKAPEATTAAPAPTTAAPEPTTAEPVPEVEKIYNRYDQVVLTMNPFEANAADSVVHSFMAARLYREWPGEDGASRYYRPELAAEAPVQMDSEGKVWQIKVREGVNFVNNKGEDTGKEITAEVFEYSFRMMLDPVLKQRAGDNLTTYVNILNAKAYFTQTAEAPIAWEDVGIKAVDKYTLEVTAALPTTEILIRKTFSGYNTAPVEPELYESLLNEDKTKTEYGTDETKVYFSGPFYVEVWNKESQEVLKRNPNYPLYDEIHFTTVNLHSVTDANTRVLMFEKGELDLVALTAAMGFEYNESPQYVTVPNRYVMSIEIGDGSAYYKKTDDGKLERVDLGKEVLDLPILADENFKKALWYAIDRTLLASLVNGRPSTYLIPDTATSDEEGHYFKDTPEALAYRQSPEEAYNPEYAKECFEKAMADNGYGPNDKLTVELIHSTAEGQIRTGEFLKEHLEKLFGVDRFELVLNGVQESVMLAQEKGWRDNPKSYQLGFGQWSLAAGDDLPMQALKVYSSSYYGRCNSSYHCEKLEEMIWMLDTDAKLSVDRAYAVQVSAEAEKAALEGLVAIPMYGKSSEYLIADRIELPIDPELGLGFFEWLGDVIE